MQLILLSCIRFANMETLNYTLVAKDPPNEKASLFTEVGCRIFHCYPYDILEV